jgi:DNA-directed RNA polymerase specialized sigma24 family protein
MPPQDSEQARWFAAEVQPGEAMLRAWLRSRFPANCDLDDIVQEAYVRILEARATSDIESPKAFLFVTARNLALGRLRHHKVAREDALAEIDAQAVLDETADVSQTVAHSQELELLTQAIQSLPMRLCWYLLIGNWILSGRGFPLRSARHDPRRVSVPRARSGEFRSAGGR